MYRTQNDIFDDEPDMPCSPMKEPPVIDYQDAAGGEVNVDEISCIVVKKENDMSLKNHTFTERFNQYKALQLIKRATEFDIPKQTVAELRKYIESSKNGLKLTNYNFGKNCENFGRLYQSNSLQHLPSKIRNTIAGEFYHDIDIVNCHPTILLQLCTILQVKCTNLKLYVEDRDTYIQTLIDTYNVDRGQAKQLFIRLINGGSFKQWKKDCAIPIKTKITSFVLDFINELTNIQSKLWDKYPEYQYNLDDKLKPKASLLARVLNVKENEILTCIVNFFHTKKIGTVDVLVFDGCMVRRSDDATDFRLDECSAYVKDESGYDIQLIEKPMTNVYNIPDAPLIDNVPNIENEEGEGIGTGPDGMPHHLTCADELDAAKVAILLHGSGLIKYCTGTLHVYNRSNGMWDHAECNIRKQFIDLYSGELGSWLSENTKWDKMVKCIKVLSIDDDFLSNMELSSRGRVLFRNGIYDFETQTLSPNFSHKYLFPFRLERNYNGSDPDLMNFVNETLFVNPFSDVETGVYLKQKLARAISGVGIEDKSAVTLIGEPNSGKGVLTDALLAAFGRYAGTVDGGVFCNNGSNTDPILRNKEFLFNRYTRILMANELNPKYPLCGTTLQKITSGGDVLEGRALYGGNIKFIPQFVPFINANDKPKVVPLNETDTGRLITLDYSFQFTTRELTPTLVNQGFKAADTTLKTKWRETKYQDAIFQLIANAYTTTKPTPPASVTETSDEWNSGDDFITLFNEDFTVTKLESDTIKNSELLQWALSKGLEISATKIGLKLKKLEGISVHRKTRGRYYAGIKKNTDGCLIIDDDTYSPQTRKIKVL